jgi:hypothetical protein
MKTLIDCPYSTTLDCAKKADPHAYVCYSEHHDNDHSCMSTQEASSDDSVVGTTSSEERMPPVLPLLIMTIDNYNMKLL